MPVRTSARLPRPLALAGVALLVAALTAVCTAGPMRPVPRSISLVAQPLNGTTVQPRPTNAAALFKWGLSAWEDEFIDPLSRQWHTNHPRLVRNQVGMLTLDATRRSGTVWATVPGSAHRYGRWEARVRAEQDGRGTPYRVLWELVPGGDYACGSKNLEIAGYHVGDRRARVQLHTPAGTTYGAGKRLDLRDEVWHTYAVEITRQHVAWFVDTRVVRTERRDAALLGTDYRMRFRLQADKGRPMRSSRMQMDWVRYYSLERDNARSISAPRLDKRRSDAGC